MIFKDPFMQRDDVLILKRRAKQPHKIVPTVLSSQMS